MARLQKEEELEYILDLRGEYGFPWRVYERNVRTGRMKTLTPLLSNGLGFPSPQQQRFLTSDKPHVFFGGSRGPGKTECLCWDALIGMYRVPGSHQAIFRRTMGELERTIIAWFRKQPEKLAGRYIGEPGNEHQILPCQNDPPCAKSPCPHSSYIFFISAPTEDSVRRLLSGEFWRVFFDEWSEFPYRMWRFISGSVRTPKEEDIFGNPIVAQVKGCSNPGGIGGDALNHLFGAEVEKSLPLGDDGEYDPNEYDYIHTTIADNPSYAADRPAGRAYRKMLASQPPNIRASWIDGKWSGFEGQYFDCFLEATVKFPHADVLSLIEKQYWQPIAIGGDWGQVHYAVFYSGTFIDLALHDGSIHCFPLIFSELMRKGLSEPALAEELVEEVESWNPTRLAVIKKRITKVYMSPETFGESKRSRAAKINQVLQRNQLPKAIPAANSRADGWRNLYSLLSERYTLMDGRMVAGILIDENCEKALEAIPWAVASQDPKKEGDIDVSDKSHPFLDVLDALRYQTYSYVAPREKSNDDKFKDKINSLPVTGMQRYAAYLQRVKELREQQPKTSISKWAGLRHPRRRH